VIVLGNFNARVGNNTMAEIKQRFNEDVRNENGDLLVDSCIQYRLQINNTFFNHKKQHKITFNNSRSQESIIDYVITNYNII